MEAKEPLQNFPVVWRLYDQCYVTNTMLNWISVVWKAHSKREMGIHGGKCLLEYDHLQPTNTEDLMKLPTKF